ncbi:MAG: AbrB/MazE/SpoVT family DNA-binding domain-containing protein [Clostridia bacterium]|nr:AbrB/MazE/SpoVT family DNA-binding domain-containing protein [Clostridia bacterium]
MKKFVFNRQVDVLGRIVLPIELRHNLGIEAKDTVKLIPVENGILIVPSKQN